MCVECARRFRFIRWDPGPPDGASRDRSCVEHAYSPYCNRNKSPATRERTPTRKTDHENFSNLTRTPEPPVQIRMRHLRPRDTRHQSSENAPEKSPCPVHWTRAQSTDTRHDRTSSLERRAGQPTISSRARAAARLLAAAPLRGARSDSHRRRVAGPCVVVERTLRAARDSATRTRAGSAHPWHARRPSATACAAVLMAARRRVDRCADAARAAQGVVHGARSAAAR